MRRIHEATEDVLDRQRGLVDPREHGRHSLRCRRGRGQWEWIKRDELLLRSAIAESVASPAPVALVAHSSERPTRRVSLSEDTIGRLGAMVRGVVQNACYMVHSMLARQGSVQCSDNQNNSLNLTPS